MLIYLFILAQEGTRYIYQFRRILQNMSHFNLLGDSYLKLPSIPNLNHTMLFIETNKCFPLNSFASLDKHGSENNQDLDECENSLSLDLQNTNHATLSSSSNIKKKKGGCTCKKTKCLKMYCQCFSSGKMCTPECSCYGCSNDHDHSDCIQKAKQLIKVKILSASKTSQGKGCNCRKSQCQKKYCQCFNAGVACGSACKCQECANGDPCGSHARQQQSSQDQAQSIID